jgi:hypothetical protein
MKITKKVSNYLSNTLSPGRQSTIDTPYMDMFILKGNKLTLSNRTISFHRSVVRLPPQGVLFAGKLIERYDLFDLKVRENQN